MEKMGIGRPSTYSSIIEIILERNYVEKKDIKGKKVDTLNYILEKNNIKNKKDHLTIGGEKKKMIPMDLGIRTIDFLDTYFSVILDTNFTANLEENLDNIANARIEWTQVLKDFYLNFEPCVKNLKGIKVNKNDNKRLIGNDFDGKPIYVYIAKYGPVFQIGEGKTKNDIKYVPISSEYSIDTVTIDDFNNMIKYPKLLGKYEDKDIYLKKGKFGLYISHNDINYSVLEKFDQNINLDEAIECIIYKNNGANNTNEEKKSTLIKKIDDYLIKNGPYGPYIHFKNNFYSIPNEYNPEELTKENCIAIIKIPKKSKK